MSLHNLGCHIYLLNTRQQRAIREYSMSNVLVMFNEYLGVFLMNKALIEEFREKMNNKDK
jgi:hypothetical protein